MPKSPLATQKFVKDELFKYNTLIADALMDFRREMRAGFEQIGKRFEQIDGRFEEVDERFDTVATKTEVLEHKVELMGELKIIREELAANANIDIRQNKRLDRVETHLNLATL